MSTHRKKSIDKSVNMNRFFEIGKITVSGFTISAILALMAAVFEGVSLYLLLPLAKGIIIKDFDFAMTIPVIKVITLKISRLFGGRDITIFIVLLAAVFLATLAKNIAQYFSSINVAYQMRVFSNNIRSSIFERYLAFGKLFFDRTSKSYLMSTIVDHTSIVANNIISLNATLYNALIIVIYIIAIFVIAGWKIMLFTILVFPILFLSVEWLIDKLKKSSYARTDTYNALSRNILNILSCVPIVKLYGTEEKEKRNFAGLNSQLSKLEFSIDKKNLLFLPFQDIVILAVVLILISLSAWVVVKEKSREISSLLVYFYIVKKCSAAFSLINYTRGSFAAIFGSIKNILEIFDNEEKFCIEDGEQEFEGLKYHVEIKHLTFSYREGVEVLKDVSFLVEKNKITALVGSSGSGKTTIINLILRFYASPPETIFIDGIDLSQLRIKSFRKHIALVSQDTLLFNDTLRKNITYGLENKISDEELINVTKKARLYDFILKLPEKFETHIGDMGIQLSGGEKQRVAIARALLKGAEILILDEATSALDSKTENLIQEAISEAIKDRTVIVIAHRLSTIKHADKIIVIENGQLIEEGSLQKLINEKGKFYEYWEEQKFY